MKLKRFNENMDWVDPTKQYGHQTASIAWKSYNNEIKDKFNQISKNSEIILESISTIVNRTLWQSKFLFVLCDMDIYKYMVLEEKIKNNHISYCPVDKKSIDKIISIKEDKSNFFKFSS